MTSQGQRFRRRALRRGYKVDEVDSFLDRVEATLAGEQSGAPVGAQEVHDVVFRVRFGGYDEWQVDLHLDRVERQLAELEDRGGRPGDPRMAPDRMSSDSGMARGGADRMAGMDRGGMDRGGMDRGGMGQGMDRGGMGQGGMDRGGMDRGGMDRGGMGQGGPDRGGMDRGGMGQGGMGPDRGMGPGMMPERMNQVAPPTERIPLPARDDRQIAPPPPRPITSMPAPGNQDPYGRYEEPGYGQPRQPPQQQPPAPPGGYDTGSYDAFEPGRHGKSDMTAEIRLPERGFGNPPMNPPPMPNSPMSGPPLGGPQGGPGGELGRVDQLRRTFQPRRFGSGYDPMQVDRLFEEILMAMSGRGPMPVHESELDTLQFGLVPGGYFEAEVDAALREVQDILRRR